MKPYLENIPRQVGGSLHKLNRRLQNGIPFLWHHHPEVELTLTLNCKGQRFIGDSAEQFDDGDLVLVGANLPHSWVAHKKKDKDEPFIALVIWFDIEWLKQLAQSAPEFAPIKKLADNTQRGLKFSPAVSKAVRAQYQELFELPPQETLLYFLGILSKLAKDDDAIALASTHVADAGSDLREPLDRVLSHIHQNYTGTIRVRELAKIAALSISGLNRMFKKNTQTTISDYLINLRIGAASAKLSTTTHPVQVIAQDVGYASLANFNRHFKRLRGLTPREYRRTFETN